MAITVKIQEYIDKKGLSEDVKKAALVLLIKASDATTGHGRRSTFARRDEKASAAAILYLACQQCHVVETMMELASGLGTDKNSVSV